MNNHRQSLIQSCLVGGLCLASLHLTWVILVLLAWAQPLMDFIFKLHMLSSPFQVQPFHWGYALSLITITFGVGFFFGLVFYLIQNAIQPVDENGI